MKRQLLFIAMLLLCSIGLFAQHRSEKEAIQIANKFFGKKTPNKQRKLSVVPQQKVSSQIKRRVASANPSQNSSCYIVNDEANNRFVIVSADERMYEVLGYSDNGCFEAENAPDGLMELMAGYDIEYNFVINNPQTFPVFSPKKESVIPVSPLIKSKWGQGSPFNLQCPLSSNGSKSVSGCVATAMAQILNYFGRPSLGQGGWERYTTRSTNTLQSMYYDTLTIDWTKIKDTYLYHYDNGKIQLAPESTDEENNEVAKLMHACGVSVFMDYDTGSGAYPSDVPYALIKHFGYNPNIVCVRRECYSNEEWNAMIMEELNAHRPVIYGAQDGEYGGHEFIIDGINDDGLYHFNFGWIGHHDGYFSIDAIDPDKYKFHLDHDMVIRATPDYVEGEKDNIYFNQFNLKSSVSVGGSCKVNLSFKLYSNQLNSQKFNFDGNVGVGVFDKDWNLIDKLYDFDADKLGYYNKLLMQPQYVYWPDSYDDSGLLESYVDFSELIFGKQNTQLYIAPYAIINSTIVRGRHLNGEKNWYRATTLNGKVILEPDSVIEGYIPPIPPAEYDTIPDWLVGTYDVSALDDINKKTSAWQVSLLKDDADSTKCWFYNIDEMLMEKGYSSTMNKVLGFMGKDGKIKIPINQSVGNEYWVRNHQSTDSIVVEISKANNSMDISDAWGVSDKSTGEIISRYTRTHFNLYVPEDSITMPLINVDEEHHMSISCTTKDVVIKYTYTRNGEEPTNNSATYNGIVTLDRNGIVKAVAFKDGRQSQIATLKINSFTVTKPTIHEAEDGKTITIETYMPSSTVYYTIDGEKPSSSTGIKYESPFECNVTTRIQAIAIREDWNDSPIDTLYHIVPDTIYTIIANNIAGELPSRIAKEEKMEVQTLRITGYLNGTDIKFIRDMIIEGKLSHLDMEATWIVEGGDEYYTPAVGSGEKTSNNVIGRRMFDNCKGLISLNLPNSVTTIDSWAFVSCDGLKELIIPESCQTVKNYSIYSARNLETVSLSSNMQSFDGENFQNCPNFKSFSVASDNKCFKAIDGVLYKNDTILVKYPRARKNTSFAIPEGITVIGDRAFEYALFENITIPEGLVSIGSNAFSNCANLTDINIPNSVITVGRWSFSSCKNLLSATLSDNLKEISSYLFYNCQNLQKFKIGSKVEAGKIESSSFNGCVSLQEFSVAEDNPYYVSIGGILYSKDIKKLKRCPLALYSEELLLPEGLEEIEEDAFNGCKNLQAIQAPDSLKHISRNAFNGSSVSTLRNIASVEDIDSWAFASTKSLESFVFPENIGIVNSYTFYNSDQLQYIYLPAKICEFGDNAFCGCKALSFVDSKIKDIDAVNVAYSSFLETYTPFTNIPDTCTWRVPAGCTERYKAQPWWVSTWRIVEDAEYTHETIVLDKKIRTFCSTSSLDFSSVSELKAYIASGFDATTGEIVLTRVEKVPAKTGVILTGKAGSTYQVAFAATDMVYSNLLKGVTAPTEITNGYVLEWDGDDCQFAAVDGSQTLKAGEAYLDMPNNDVQNVKLRFGDGRTLDEVMGISIVQSSAEQDNAWYTLQGVRIEGRPTRQGIYIHQGRKVSVRK